MRMIPLLKSKLITFGFIVLTACPINLYAKDKNVGIINTMSGFVENYHEGSAKPEQMKPGSKIYINDRLITMKNSKAQIIFRNDSAITLGPESELIITNDSFDKSSGKRETVLSLVKGKVRSVIGKSYSQNGSKFEVHTSTAIAGARGTQNLIDSQQQPDKTTVYGIEDTTFVRNSDDTVGGETDLGPNKGANVLPGQPPELFDFEFTDPAFTELMNSTTQQGGEDAENDLSMGALEDEQKFEEPEKDESDVSQTQGPSDFQMEKIEERETPPVQEESETQPGKLGFDENGCIEEISSP